MPVLTYALVIGTGALAYLGYRWWTGHKAPILIGLLMVGMVAGGVVEARWRAMDSRYTHVSKDLLGRDDTYVVCGRFTGALFNVWNRAGYVAWTEDGSKPSRADLTWETCRALRKWEGSDQTAGNLEHVIAVHVLTHEIMHLNGHYGEAEAECYAIQHDSRVAQLLGASVVEADQLALSYFRNAYPRMPAEYVSGECKPGGLLDQTPGDRHWP